MDMNSDKSISLSQCCVVLFALLLAALLLRWLHKTGCRIFATL